MSGGNSGAESTLSIRQAGAEEQSYEVPQRNYSAKPQRAPRLGCKPCGLSSLRT
jgi:hypothetical protein